MPSPPVAVAAAKALDRLRERRPRIHCITNAVAQAFTANLLLAAGAVPSMTISADEVADFVARADALLINLGTLDAARRQAIAAALEAAGDEKKPWVLDPVFVDRSAARADYARELLQRRPGAVRLNRAEFEVLADREFSADALKAFVLAQLTVVGLTGEIDLVTDGAQFVSLANGHPLMARVTAMGCAGSALNAAFMAVEDDGFLATAGALLVLGVAGEIAAARSDGPGSFASNLLDAVYNLDSETLIAKARVT
jgi:hydroxyethylthiazole kinase